MSHLIVSFNDEHLLAGRMENVVVAVWRGDIDDAHVRALSNVAYGVIRDATRGGGALLVFEEGAREVSVATRDVSAELVEAAGSIARAMAIVVEGPPEHARRFVDRQADVYRRAGTPAALTALRDVPTACQWLATKLREAGAPSVDPHLMARAIADARRGAMSPSTLRDA